MTHPLHPAERRSGIDLRAPDDMDTLALPVMLAGGGGSRLWPLSRTGHPKQFLHLHEERASLFQQAVERLQALAGDGVRLGPLLAVVNEEHRFLCLDQLRRTRSEGAVLLLEPCGRNTAAALTLAALQAARDGADPVLFASPADQVVVDTVSFQAAARAAIREAATGSLVVLGVPPTHPETGYGYIQADVPKEGVAPVRRFVEKPDLATARRLLDEGDFYWNSGSFALRASVWLDALETLRPDISSATRAAFALRTMDDPFVRPDRSAFAAIPAESIDRAVMEHVPNSGRALRMVPLDAGWNDLGAWEAIWAAARKDDCGNARRGDVMLEDSRDSLVHATSRLVAVLGLEGVVVVETPDAVLVADRSRSQDVRRLVDRMASDGRSELAAHRKVHRPWGWYDSVDAGPRFQVKRICVRPGAALSLQMHHHRAEHWIVVAGTAEITCGDKRMLLTENQSTYIPLGVPHRLSNPGKLPLELIEVQSGPYLGEDDIVRFDDTYGRA